MYINKIEFSSQNNNINPSNKPSFGGLTKLLSDKVMALPYEKAVEVVASYKKQYLYAGYFPKDLLKIIQKNSSSPQDTKNKIKIFNKFLSDLAKNITSFDDKVIENINAINIEDYMYMAIKKCLNKKYDHIGHVDYPFEFKLQPEKMEEILNNSEFTVILNKFGIIGDGEKIKFTFVGNGTYKNCFKLQILDKEGKDVIHPKAFVIGQNEELGQNCNKIIAKRMEQYFSQTSLVEFEKKFTTRINSDTSLSQEEKLILKDEMLKFYNGKYKTSYIYNGAGVDRDFKDINGIFPEANAALKICKDLGDSIDDSNIIRPYIFDLKNKFGLLEFADKNLKPTTHKYDFKEHHLEWIDDKNDNLFDGKKILDFGCIFPDYKSYYI